MPYKSTRSSALIIGALGLLLGAIGPWIQVFGFVNLGPTDSLDLALVIFGGIGLLFVCALMHNYMRVAAFFVGWVVLIECVRVLIRMHNADDSNLMRPGWGMYISIGVAWFLVAVPWITRNKE